MLGVSHAEREKMEDQQDSEAMVLGTRGPDGFTNPPDSDPARKTKTHSFFDVFSPDVRARTALAAFMMGMQQLSGIDGVLYVSSSPILSKLLQSQLTYV